MFRPDLLDNKSGRNMWGLNNKKSVVQQVGIELL
jgi:hypothetical protein